MCAPIGPVCRLTPRRSAPPRPENSSLRSPQTANVTANPARDLRPAHLPELHPDGLGSRIELRRIGIQVGVIEIEIVHAADWDEMDVGMRHFESGDHHPDLDRLKSAFECGSDRLAHARQVGEQIRVEVDPMLYLVPGTHEHMPGRHRVD